MFCVSVEELAFKYKGGFKLGKISLRFCESEITAILGPNGAGKTTFLKCLARILKPLEGVVYIGNKELWSLSLNEVAKSIGFSEVEVPQGFNVKVVDFISTSRYPHMRTFWETENDVEQIIESIKRLKLESLSQRKLEELSSGEFQRVIIAKILAKNPKILLLDEPTLHLDIKYQLEILKTISEITKEKKLVTIITLHDLKLASLFADKVVLLKNGKVVAFGKPNEVLTPENIERVYEVKVKVIRDKEAGMIITPLIK